MFGIQKTEWIWPSADNLENSEVLEPGMLRYLRLRFNPYTQLIQIIYSYAAIQETLTDMALDGYRKLTPGI